LIGCLVNILNPKRILLYIAISPYRAVNTFHHGYKNQPINDV
jgi:threonine/homoserine/homoserine lactone efflux protein